jgi:putative PIN family toxin of toxin-antitoxin system
MKVIIDTNVYFSGYIFDKTILSTIDYCYNNYEIYTSEAILKELELTLFGKKAKKLKKDFDSFETLDFFLNIKLNSIVLNPAETVKLCRDPKDNMFLDLAKISNSNYIITGDKDLLSLKEFENTEILKPGQFLDLIKEG